MTPRLRYPEDPRIVAGRLQVRRHVARAYLIAAAAIALLCLAATLLSGCAWRPETRAAEAAYQVVHAVDAAQTLEVAEHGDCYREVQSRAAIGAHPTPDAVFAYMAATAGLHAAVTAWLENTASIGWRRTWQVVTIAPAAATVGHNFSIGLRVGGARACR